MKLGRMVVVLAALVFSGCAAVNMKQEGVMTKPVTQDKAKMVFLRHSFVGSAISASLFDVTDEQEKFIGIHQNGTRIEYLVVPGDHLFMVIGESADFMAASLEAGKTYHAITTPRVGVWKARFSLIPIRKSGNNEFSVTSNDFKTWMEDPLVDVNQESEEWYRNNRTSIAEKRREYIVKWNEKSVSDKKERTLQQEDGL